MDALEGLSPTCTHFSISTVSSFERPQVPISPQELSAISDNEVTQCIDVPSLGSNPRPSPSSKCYFCHDLIARLYAIPEDGLPDTDLQLDVSDHLGSRGPSALTDPRFCGFGSMLTTYLEQILKASGAACMAMLNFQDYNQETEKTASPPPQRDADGICIHDLQAHTYEPDVTALETGMFSDYDKYLGTPGADETSQNQDDYTILHDEPPLAQLSEFDSDSTLAPNDSGSRDGYGTTIHYKKNGKKVTPNTTCDDQKAYRKAKAMAAPFKYLLKQEEKDWLPRAVRKVLERQRIEKWLDGNTAV